MTDNIVKFPAEERHINVTVGNAICIISVRDIKQIASGETVLANFAEPETTARALAAIALDFIKLQEIINGNNR
jgi:hypothetical protein